MRDREDALARLRADHPGAGPDELMRRAIELGDADAASAVADLPGFEPSASYLWAALREGDPALAGLLGGLAGLSLAAGVPEHAAWDWVAGRSLATLRALVERFPEAARLADADGVTALHAAVADGRGPEKVAYLLEHGADPDARQHDGTTPLYRAALAGNAAAVRLLLAHGVDTAARSDDLGWTALMAAAAEGFAEVAGELLGAGDPNARDESGATALHLAAARGHAEAAARLAGEPGVDVNLKDGAGRTPLSLAAFGGHADVVATLLSRPDLDPNLVDRDRQTALHWAAMGGHLDIVHALLADGRANPGIRNRDGATARELAEAGGHRAIVALLDRNDAGSDDLSPGDGPPERPAAPPEEPETRIRRPGAP